MILKFKFYIHHAGLKLMRSANLITKMYALYMM